MLDINSGAMPNICQFSIYSDGASRAGFRIGL
jgi:hypothetical protein